MLSRKLILLCLICISSVSTPLFHSQESPQPPSTQNRTVPGLAVTPTELKFEKQALTTTSAARSLLLTNNSNSPLSGIHILLTADFEAAGNCQDLAAGASCIIMVTFTPRITGDIAGSLSIFATPSEGAKGPAVVSLHGVGISYCNAPKILWNSSSAIIVVLAVLYFLALIIVRWNLIAKRDRAELEAYIESIHSWVEAYKEAHKGTTSLQHIDDLLKKARNGSKKLTRLLNALLWARGSEYAGWILAHQAEQQLVAILPFERVRARLEAVELCLRQSKDVEAKAMADRLLDASKTSTAAHLERFQALLAEGLRIVHADEEDEFNNLDIWHNKMLWLVACALILIVAVALAFQNPILLLVGAVGGLLSRLSQNLRAAKVVDDYGAPWGAMFLSPLSGALAAWGGILLVTLAAKLNILGSALNFDWCNPYEPTVLALALLLGFTERLFDDIATGLDKKLTNPDNSNNPESTNTPRKPNKEGGANSSGSGSTEKLDTPHNSEPQNTSQGTKRARRKIILRDGDFNIAESEAEQKEIT